MRPGKVHSWLQPDSVLYKVTRNSANYQLTGFLLDRNLNDFARYLPQYYPADSLRPRYYKEALKILSLKKRGLRLIAPYKKVAMLPIIMRSSILSLYNKFSLKISLQIS